MCDQNLLGLGVEGRRHGRAHGALEAVEAADEEQARAAGDLHRVDVAAIRRKQIRWVVWRQDHLVG